MSARGGGVKSFRSSIASEVPDGPPIESIISQCARPDRRVSVVSHVNRSGYGSRGRSRTKGSYASVPEGHQLVSCPASGCGIYVIATPALARCCRYGSTSAIGYSGSCPPLATNRGLVGRFPGDGWASLLRGA